MNKVNSAQFVKKDLMFSGGSITVETVDCKHLLLIHYRLVCYSCSNNSWYVPGY